MKHILDAYIIEDEPKAIENLRDMIVQHCPGLRVVGASHNLHDSWTEIVKASPSLVFVDMHLPDGLGHELINEPETKGVDFVFTTADEGFAVKAFELGAVDYLLKPISIKRLRKAVQRVIEKRNTASKEHVHPNTNRIALPVIDGLEFVDSQNILYCSASGPYVQIHLNNGDTKLISKNLGKFEELLSHKQFLRIHDSHLVNVNRVSKYIRGRGGQVVMDNGTVLGVAQRRKDLFLEHFSRLKPE